MTFYQILSFGDSFTYGTDLSDCDQQRFSRSTWPALIAEHEQLHYKSLAEGGSGNQRIAFRIMEHYGKSTMKERNLYIVNWTWLERFDYIDPATDNWNTIHPMHDGSVEHFFFKNLDSQPWNIIRNLQLIWSVISFLKTHDCKFVMTCLDDTLWTKNYSFKYTPAISSLQNMIRPYFFDFDGKNFLDWANENSFHKGLTGHPLEDAHREAYKIMHPTVKSLLI